MISDSSNGYDDIADTFIQVRSTTSGVSTVQGWANRFKPGDTVLDIGSGSGLPLTKVLIDLGLKVSAIDASPKMVAAFRKNFPHTEITCEAAEESSFLHRKFDGVLAVGLIFLLSPEVQRQLILRIADAVKPGGHLLFSAPKETGSWDDLLTKRQSHSLGEDSYIHLLESSGLVLNERYTDEGGSYYYAAARPAS
ncbi:MAG: class I SAM-dependent methyltransferase [Litorimonas sp.]